ncbi:MAG TPA: hypothetical protein VHE54_11425 [Puia sp.]|nr:hypothetical protein [Puia sp.]
MKNEQLQHEVRKARIYKGIYRPSSNPARLLSTLVSIILHGHSQVGGSGFGRERRS